MRARQSPERRRQTFGVAAGGRPEGHQSLDPCAAWLRKTVQGKIRQLDVPDRARTGLERAAGVPAARKGARRLELDQRLVVRAWPARGLRSLASARQCRLGL